MTGLGVQPNIYSKFLLLKTLHTFATGYRAIKLEQS